MTAKDDRKNAEGYNDPTAYNAIKNVEQEQDKDDVRFHQLLNMLFSLCELADFHIEGRVHFRPIPVFPQRAASQHDSASDFVVWYW